LADLADTRTDHDRTGTIRTEWDNILFWRDIERFIGSGVVVRIGSRGPDRAYPREQQFFREVSTGDIYIYTAGWERGCPEFRKLPG